MHNFDPIRIAVNVCLIVATTIQPVAACLVRAGESSSICTAVAQESFTCGGCGCCEVESETDRCCCCESSEETNPNPQATAKHLGCGDAATDALSEATDGGAGSIEPLEGTIRAVCLCEQPRQPLKDPSPRRGPSENRETLCDRFTDDNGAAWNALRTSAASRQLSLAKLAPHHSQVVLCIWRL